ncbi:1,2-dihydroxy-3-keto-5-methylthiopentene dioxygenase [Exophiala sideris]|uniref:1,2-dihydroxy-3-keto-5-methylthiopentene dioxygenase n=1 Tax=Exophiala sideris TaxID=1016849 RepID=A0ABR0JMG2_9EURO|nr:1,2-dihydroxy-3-keto-5-methylthiopentene dioxygenase [Exophiala sideris]KAK5043652.1 1,2-dihydroxy-3-keto-5-methylthiopentene dioxygenase [Exophiala sideris]KAK5067151.1 1,2-dihydroxy-3-keto-5-methylthiopentene dioxygenase [Exophiala sideris]KAK5182484.1 1,2-dihydroxy-3-keto-5-methylthiopentene dioxygenase [Eurotiomycetes sp. CCFEE 6388]
MAWQSGAGGSSVGGMSTGEPNGVQAYTLQGVMRFLQTEWHRHERDRNAWEIEREEMKNRVAILEGETRTSKGIRTSLERHVKLLEVALKRERDRARSADKGEEVESQKGAKEIARDELKAIGKDPSLNSVGHFDQEIDPESQLVQGVRQEKERDKSKGYLSKCSSEITYHVLPTNHVPPELNDPPLSANASNVFPGRQPSQQELQEAYLQLQQVKQQQHRNIAMVRENAAPQQQTFAESTALSRSNTQINVEDIRRNDTDGRIPEQMIQTVPAVDSRKNFYNEAMHIPEDQVESISHSFDAYGREIPLNDQTELRSVEDHKQEVSDAWDFDDGPSQQEKTEPTAQHRLDIEVFPSANLTPSKSPSRAPGSYRRKSSGARRRSEGSNDARELAATKTDASQFKVRFAMRGHLDVVRAVIFTGGGSPSEPEFCTASDDGGVKRWHIPASYPHNVALGDDLDRIAHFTHRGHVGAVCSLAACSASPNFSSGGRAAGDGWIFSGGEDGTVKVWERGRVDAKATLEGHKDAVWALCCLPGTTGSILGDRCSQFGGPDRVLLVGGGSDGTILVWAVSTPPQLSSPPAGSRSARGSRRANSISAGSNFPSSPQPSIATTTPFNYSLVHRIERAQHSAPTSISPLGPHGESFVVSYNDASALIFDTRTGEEIVGMASQETYDGSTDTGINAVVASSTGFDTRDSVAPGRRGSMGEDDVVHGATGSDGGVEGVVIAGYEDRYIRFFDANSGQCTYTMLAHPSAISSLSLSPDGKELVSGGHDASLRFWSLEKRSCTQEISSHRIMRGEGVCSVVWSPDGRWVISCGGDGAVKVFSRN